METHASVVSEVEDLAYDWLDLQYNKHNRHILSVNGFVNFYSKALQ